MNYFVIFSNELPISDLDLAMKVVFRSNMHIEARVIEVAGFKYEAIFIALFDAGL